MGGPRDPGPKCLEWQFIPIGMDMSFHSVWNGWFIPTGIKWIQFIPVGINMSFHSSCNGLFIPVRMNWLKLIPIGIKWDHFIPLCLFFIFSCSSGFRCNLYWNFFFFPFLTCCTISLAKLKKAFCKVASFPDATFVALKRSYCFLIILTIAFLPFLNFTV